MPLSPSLARSFFLLSLIYELRDSSACSFFCKSKTAGSAGREKCWSLSLSLSPSLARDFDGRTQNEEARARSEKGKKNSSGNKKLQRTKDGQAGEGQGARRQGQEEERELRREQGREEEGQGKRGREWEKRWKGGADRCDWFQRWRRRLDSDSESALRESRRLCCILRCFVWMCRPCAVTLSVCVAQKKRRDSAETDRRREREA